MLCKSNPSVGFVEQSEGRYHLLQLRKELVLLHLNKLLTEINNS